MADAPARIKQGPLSGKRVGLLAGPEFSDFQAYYLNLYLSELGRTGVQPGDRLARGGLEDDPPRHLEHRAGHVRIAPRPDPDHGARRPLHHARVPRPGTAQRGLRGRPGCADRARRPLRRRAARRPRRDRLRVLGLPKRRAGRRPGVRPDGADERRRDRRPAGHRLPRGAARRPRPRRLRRGDDPGRLLALELPRRRLAGQLCQRATAAGKVVAAIYHGPQVLAAAASPASPPAATT